MSRRSDTRANPGSPGSPTRPLGTGTVSYRLYAHDAGPSEQLAELRTQARLAVEAGYDGVMIPEHHGGFAGYLPNPAAVAAHVLENMPSGWAAPCPVLLPMRPPALVAEELAWLAAAHPGRVGAGFAAGAVPADFELGEIPFDEIVPRFKAALPVVVAALRGRAEGPLAEDRAIAACADHPVPMAVAVQSVAAAERAARLQLAVLYDSLQGVEHLANLSQRYADAGGRTARILIRRVWIGDPPRDAIERQMEAFRSVTTESDRTRWGAGSNTIFAADGVEAAERLTEAVRATGCDTLNLRVMVLGLAPAEVHAQLERHATELLPRLRVLLDPARG